MRYELEISHRCFNESSNLSNFYVSLDEKKKRECDIFIKKKEKINNNNNKHTIMMLNIIKQCATCATRRAGYVNKRFMSFSYPSPRTLAEITNLPLLEAEDANGIKTIWETHHDAQETCISGTMTGTQYDTLFKRLAESQYFVLPVKRDEGHFVLLSQALS